jgi:hypothetical protein
MSYLVRKVSDLHITSTEALSMGSWLLTSTLDVTESDPQSLSSESRRINIGSVDTQRFSGRAVMMRGIATRRHFYSASLNNGTSLSSIIHSLYSLRETKDRRSVSMSYLQSGNHLTQKMVAL